MRRSARTTAAMKNFRHRLDSRAAQPPSEEDGLVRRGPGAVKVVDPDVRALIDAALARRDR